MSWTLGYFFLYKTSFNDQAFVTCEDMQMIFMCNNSPESGSKPMLPGIILQRRRRVHRDELVLESPSLMGAQLHTLGSSVAILWEGFPGNAEAFSIRYR